MVEVADAVPIEICCELALVIVIAPVKVSWGSAIKSPTIPTGILTEVVPAAMV